MTIQSIIEERTNDIIPWKHLCTRCQMIYYGDGYYTTLDEHACHHCYQKGVEQEDNGGGFWVIECPSYVEMDTSKLYREWIRSSEWTKIATEAKRKVGYKCELCGSAINIGVHHITYDHLCMEDRYPEDLLVVCKKCHQKLHEKDIENNFEKPLDTAST